MPGVADGCCKEGSLFVLYQEKKKRLNSSSFFFSWYNVPLKNSIFFSCNRVV